MGGYVQIWGWGMHPGEARCAGWEHPCREVARGQQPGQTVKSHLGAADLGGEASLQPRGVE